MSTRTGWILLAVFLMAGMASRGYSQDDSGPITKGQMDQLIAVLREIAVELKAAKATEPAVRTVPASRTTEPAVQPVRPSNSCSPTKPELIIERDSDGNVGGVYHDMSKPSDKPYDWEPTPAILGWTPADGQRPKDMPPPKGNGREFDGGPAFGKGSWAQRDEDGVWRRYGG